MTPQDEGREWHSHSLTKFVSFEIFYNVVVEAKNFSNLKDLILSKSTKFRKLTEQFYSFSLSHNYTDGVTHLSLGICISYLIFCENSFSKRSAPYFDFSVSFKLIFPNKNYSNLAPKLGVKCLLCDSSLLGIWKNTVALHLRRLYTLYTHNKLTFSFVYII